MSSRVTKSLDQESIQVLYQASYKVSHHASYECHFTWHVKCHITCNSINTIYYLVCSCCNNTSYIGKTNNLRKRMNCHISEIRTGNTTDLFDKHVIKCKNLHNLSKEPFFKIYALITLPNEESLLTSLGFLLDREIFESLFSWKTPDKNKKA